MKFLNLDWPVAMIRSCYYGSTALEIGFQPRCSQSSSHLTDQNDYSVILGGSRHSLLALGCPYAYGPCSTVYCLPQGLINHLFLQLPMKLLHIPPVPVDKRESHRELVRLLSPHLVYTAQTLVMGGCIRLY